MKTTTKVDENTLELLRSHGVAEGNLIKLTCGQLEPATYKAVDKVLKHLGGKWNRTKGGHVFDRPAGPLLEEVLGNGKLGAKNPLAFFATPIDVISQMLVMADLASNTGQTVFRVLEPSAGDGRLAAACRGMLPAALIECIECDPVRGQNLRSHFTTTIGDFLTIAPSLVNRFDRVLMNPPFATPEDPLAWMTHTIAAFRCLKLGGRLIGIAPCSWQFATRPKAIVDFRDFVRVHGAWRNLPDGAFSESGTNVKCTIVQLER